MEGKRSNLPRVLSGAVSPFLFVRVEDGDEVILSSIPLPIPGMLLQVAED